MTTLPRRVRRDMWSGLQYPDDWTPLPFVRRFTASEFERMAAGLVPRDMDDKWFVYLEADTLYFHRSWTGLCVFRIKLLRAGEEFVVAEAAIGRYPPVPSPWWQFWHRLHRNEHGNLETETSESTALLALIVDVGLLGKPDPRPIRPHPTANSTG